ncbi:MAG: DUF1002 domain-containing protein [Tissierellia bacterium]|nr:DUF1002 domain-containing protein [Tissierellia bacterium]
MNKKKFKNLIIIFLAILIFSIPNISLADEYTEIISIGADLNQDQREQIIEKLDAKSAKIIEVTNEEEKLYLGDFISEEKIGNQALSCAKIEILPENKGLEIKVDDNITFITEKMYRNALITAGIIDAKVNVGALQKVTGTGALTGILKAYEEATGEVLDPDLKKIANEELVITQDIATTVGKEKASEIINIIKVKFSENMPKTENEARDIIVNISNEYNIELTDKQIDKLTNLFMKMKDVDIDWEEVSKKANDYAKKAKEFLESEKGQSFLQSIKNGFVAFIDFIASLFKK